MGQLIQIPQTAHPASRALQDIIVSREGKFSAPIIIIRRKPDKVHVFNARHVQI
jgi:hypothetical protein